MKQFLIRLNQIGETWKTSGFNTLKNKMFFWNKDFVLVEKELSTAQLKPTNTKKSNFEFIEISKEKIGKIQDLNYSLKSRQLKLEANLAKGYEGFAVVWDNMVLGDVWYVGRNDLNEKAEHPDLKFLKIKLDPKEAYLNDMYINADKRGGGLVNFLLGQSLHALKKKGFKKIYGSYETDNIPALWMHRSLGYKEVRKLQVQRFLFFVRSKN